MSKSVTRIAASVLLVGLATAGLTACDEKPPSASDAGAALSKDVKVGAMEDYTAKSTFKATEPVDFSLLYSDQPAYPEKEDWLLWSQMQKANNVKLSPTVVPFADYTAKRSLVISSGDAPDIISKTYPGEEAQFAASGAVLPISDYAQYMPHYQQKIKDWKMEGDIDTLRQSDGKYYLLPGLHEEVWQDYTLVVRTDIFEKNKIDIPTTWDELKTALGELKKAYPDITPYSDRFSTNGTGAGNAVSLAAATFGTSAGWGLNDGLTFDRSADKFQFGAQTPEYKEVVEYFRELVDAGLMDPASFSQPDDEAVQKFTTGKSFVISGNSQNVVTYQTTMDQTLGKGNYSVAKIPVLAGPEGSVISGSRLENGIMINAQAAKKPNFLAMLQFIDWLWYSDDGQEFAKWGVEGTTFQKEGGKRELMPDVNYNGLNPAGTVDLRVNYGFSGGVFAYGGTTDLLQSMMSPAELKFQEAMGKKKLIAPNPPHPYTDVQREQTALLVTPLKDWVNQNTLKFIIGQRPMSEWKDFTKELTTKGSGKLVKTANDAYKAYKKQVK